MAERTYRIHIAAEFSGVRVELIRAWERRYGVLSPQRTPSGYRVYTDRDVALLRRLKQLTEEGVSISEAAKMLPQLLAGLKPHQIVRLGLSHVPEGRQIFPDLTVRENLLLGAYQRRDDVRGDVARCHQLFPILKERETQKAGTLSGGEQQMLAIGRALMGRPRLLLLDEPSLGLAPLIVRRIFDIIREINAEGTTIFLVEQNAHLALKIAHRAYVLQTGQIVMADSAAALLANPEVQKAYLGG